MISVVIPYYNRSKFLNRLLESIKRQTVTPEAVYIIDNGSTEDEIAALIEISQEIKYSKLNIILLSTINKGNANYARNLGYIISDTTYVAFLDSDDWWESTHLEFSIRKLNESKKTGIYSGAIIHTRKKKISLISKDINNFMNPFSFLLSGKDNIAQTSSYVINKDKLKLNVKWDENLKRHQDLDYFLNIYYKTDGWCYSPHPLVNIDWDSGGTSPKLYDFKSIILFHKRWKSEIPRNDNINYLMNILSLINFCGTSKENEDYFRECFKSLNPNILLKLKVSKGYNMYYYKLTSTIKNIINFFNKI